MRYIQTTERIVFILVGQIERGRCECQKNHRKGQNSQNRKKEPEKRNMMKWTSIT